MAWDGTNWNNNSPITVADMEAVAMKNGLTDCTGNANSILTTNGSGKVTFASAIPSARLPMAKQAEQGAVKMWLSGTDNTILNITLN